MSRHPHYDVIVAWAEGKEIQYRFEEDQPWQDTKIPTFTIDIQYRIKPEKKKTTGYKRFIYKLGDKKAVAAALEPSYSSIEKNAYFVRWIDTEWQYEEYEE